MLSLANGVEHTKSQEVASGSVWMGLFLHLRQWDKRKKINSAAKELNKHLEFRKLLGPLRKDVAVKCETR